MVGFVEVPTCFVCVPTKDAVSMERSYDRWLRRQYGESVIELYEGVPGSEKSD